MNSIEGLPELPFDVQDSIFRTNAWCDAWLASYGQVAGVNTIDLGGAGNSLEMVYLATSKFKHLIPIKELALVGCGGFAVNSPRSEYNQLSILAQRLGGNTALLQLLRDIPWQRFQLTDFAKEDCQIIKHLSTVNSIHQQVRDDVAYQVSAPSMAIYMDFLGKNTRARYFNKRNKLEAAHKIEWSNLSVDNDLPLFFNLLNSFHIKRWSKPCYSDLSQAFIGQFLQELARAGGQVHLSLLHMDGAPVSVLLDVEWRNRRYNLQAGFDEAAAGNCKLGSIHLGRAIEEAIGSGVVYDFLAGEGLKSNYKSSIATHQFKLTSATFSRGWVGVLKKLKSN